MECNSGPKKNLRLYFIEISTYLIIGISKNKTCNFYRHIWHPIGILGIFSKKIAYLKSFKYFLDHIPEDSIAETTAKNPAKIKKARSEFIVFVSVVE